MQPVRHYDEREFPRFIQRYDQATLHGWVSELIEYHECAEFAASGYASRLVSRLSELIASGRAASCVRLGDGEGNVLAAAEPDFRDLHRLSANKISEMHLGRWFPQTVYERWSNEIANSIVEADVIGIPLRERIDWTFRHVQNSGPRGAIDFRGISGTINAVRAAHRLLIPPSSARIITSCWFHRDLLPYYENLLRGRKRIGLISCYEELPERLRSAFGIDRVDHFRIPGQISVTGRKPWRAHYPDCFNEVMESLGSLHKGQLVLVAAGFLGKIYCGRIKNVGGIALDIGSTADVWMGRRARRSHSDELIEKWKL